MLFSRDFVDVSEGGGGRWISCHMNQFLSKSVRRIDFISMITDVHHYTVNRCLLYSQ